MGPSHRTGSRISSKLRGEELAGANSWAHIYLRSEKYDYSQESWIVRHLPAAAYRSTFGSRAVGGHRRWRDRAAHRADCDDVSAARDCPKHSATGRTAVPG